MGKGAAVAIIAVIAIAALALFGPGMVTEITDSGYRLYLPIQFSAQDTFAGGADGTTTKVSVYNANYELIEHVTISTQAGTDSAMKYWSGDVVYLKHDDASDTSLCHIYEKLIVPYHSSDSDTKHYVVIKTVDTDASWDVRLDDTSENNWANAATWDTSDNGTAPTWVFKIITPTDDKGYKSSYNFLEGCDNTIYYVFKLSGTGATRVLFDTNRAIRHYFDGAYHWYAVHLSDSDITRDLKSDGTYDPIGYFTMPIKMDLTQVTSGDSVTFVHGLYYYADFDNLISNGSWGPDATSVTESITIQP